MSDQRRTPAIPIIALAILFILLATYVVGYFGLTMQVYYDAPRFRQGRGNSGYRLYREPWMAAIFGPAAAVESAVTGNTMRTGVWP